MAPVFKRTRTVVEDGSEDEEVVGNGWTSHPSPLTSRPNKRVRMSLDADSTRTPSRTVDGDDDSDEDDGDDDDGEASAGSDDGVDPDSDDAFPQTQYELMRDDGFKHLENLERDDQQAAEKLSRRSTRTVNNMPAEHGIIESVECVNFICHERLHVELGPLMNFIVGENGSGKSAVLTALTLCLGGKASDTNRGGSLKQFVKEGRDQSILIVKLKNAGSAGYKPEVYGQSIIIERHFSKSGASGFKIKNEQGKIISTKRQVVDEISEAYGLQMGNPLTVLSQDNARQFLNAATPAQKYRYFVSGVQLEQLDNDYKLTFDILEQTRPLQEDLAEKIKSLEKEMEDAKSLAQTAHQNHSLREQKRLRRAQMVWSQVEGLERQLEERRLRLTRLEEDLVRRQEDCDQYTKALEDCQERLSRAEQDRDALKDDDHVLRDKVKEAEAEWNEAKQEQINLQVQERDAHSRLKTCRAEMQNLQSKIEEEERCLGESTGSVRAEKEAGKAEASARQADLEARVQEAKANVPSLASSITDANEALKKVASSREQKFREVIAAREALRDLRTNNGPANKGFDSDIMGLVRAVNADRSFEQKPLGPIGLHVKLKKPEWSEILEKTLGDSLNAFVVRSKSDQERLSALMRRQRMGRFPPIYIAHSGAIDTTSQEPDQRFDTILRVLEFDNDVVRSQLIINSMIEKIILIKDRTEANRIMIDDREPPRNVSACICFHDGEGKRGHGLRIMNRFGSISSSPIVPLRPPRPRMQSEVVDQVAMQQENLRLLDSELESVKEDENRAKALKHQRETELRENKARTSDLEKRLRQVRADIDQISEALDAFEGVDGRLIALREEAKAKAQVKEQIGLQYGNMAVKKRELMELVEAAKRKLEAERLELRDYQSRVAKAEDKVKSCESLRMLAVGRKNSAFEDLDIGRQNRRAGEAQMEEQAEALQDFIRQAQEIAPDRVTVPEGETTESLEARYEKIAKQLQQRERRQGGSDEAIFEKAAEATKRYDDVVAQAKDVDKTVNALKHAVDRRLKQWRLFQCQISARVRNQFSTLLSERGFRGGINLDHRARKINVHIEPDQTRKSAAGRNTRTLSGGEKSFSSICMLLSVWEAMGSPIRCLDEFDVFMDNVNRAISTNLLVDAARLSVSRQYILITPNAIEGRAKLDKDVKIIRLTDPRQRTLV